MKILVFGAGAIGSAFGGFLSRQHKVTLLGRPSHLAAIGRRGLEVSGIWGRHTFRRLSIVTNSNVRDRHACPLQISNLLPFDLILVTVKSYDTLHAARAIRKLLNPGTIVLSLQNGLGNIEALHRYLPKKQVLAGRVIFGVVTTGCGIRSGGRICITVSAEPTAIGETCRREITPRVRALARLLAGSGIPAVPCRDIRALLWKKVIYNCALNPLAALLKTYYGFLGDNPVTRTVMEEVVREIYRVAAKARVRLEPGTVRGYLRLFYSKLLPSTYHHHPSMLQDLMRGKPTEIEALSGAVARLGLKYGVETPVNAYLARLIRKVERR